MALHRHSSPFIQIQILVTSVCHHLLVTHPPEKEIALLHSKARGFDIFAGSETRIPNWRACEQCGHDVARFPTFSPGKIRTAVALVCLSLWCRRTRVCCEGFLGRCFL